MTDDAGIPEFLRIPAERRAETWAEWSARQRPAGPSPREVQLSAMKRERKRIAVEKLHVRLEKAAARKAGELKKQPPVDRSAMRVIWKGE